MSTISKIVLGVMLSIMIVDLFQIRGEVSLYLQLVYMMYALHHLPGMRGWFNMRVYLLVE